MLFDRFDELGAGPGSLLLEFLVEERPDLRSDLLGLVGCWGVGETVEASLCPSFEVRAAAGVTAVGVLGNGLAVSAGGIQAHYLGLSRILGLMLVLCSMGRSCSSRLALSLRCWGLPAMSHHDKTKRGKCLIAKFILIPHPPKIRGIAVTDPTRFRKKRTPTVRRARSVRAWSLTPPPGQLQRLFDRCLRVHHICAR